MEYKTIDPCASLEPYIHCFWELKGGDHGGYWERTFPDGCPGLVLNVGSPCITDNGAVVMHFGKTYVAGTMTSFKDTFIEGNTHLFGVCLKPGVFSNFYNFAPQNELTNKTIQLENAHSFDIDKFIKNPVYYINSFFTDRLQTQNRPLQAIIANIHRSKGQSSINDLAKQNFISIRQLERNFKMNIGVSPRQYSNIVRFQNALALIKNGNNNRSLLDIAFECGFYDHSHLANEIKRNTGLSPSQL